MTSFNLDYPLLGKYTLILLHIKCKRRSWMRRFSRNTERLTSFYSYFQPVIVLVLIVPDFTIVLWYILINIC